MLRRPALAFVATATGIGGAYVVIDEERRRHAVMTAHSVYRIANLVSTAGVIVVDYGVSIQMAKSRQEAHAITLKINQLNHEIEKIQTEQEELTIEQWKSKHDVDRTKSLQQRIDRNRQRLDTASEEVGQLSSEHDAFRPLKAVHHRNAVRLRDMCAANQGLYIKLGQHLAMLDHILPEEYHYHLSSLLSNTPQSSWASVRRVIKQELGAYPEELFERIETTPIASASLAQVHVAYDKNGNKLAIKCQHEGTVL